MANKVIELIIAALGFIPGLRKKPHKLLCWDYRKKKWERMHAGALSARQCRKLQRALIERLGLFPWQFLVLRDSAVDPVDPPVEPGKA